MARWGGIDITELEQLAQRLDSYIENNDVLERVAKELTARLLGKVIPRTPVGDYPASSGKKGGTLRRGWTTATHQDAVDGENISIAQYVNSLSIQNKGGMISIEIINPVEYAWWVETGHYTVNGSKWVRGRFMLMISERELQSEEPRIVEQILMRELRKVFR